MTLLAIGVSAFIGLHLIPYFATGFRARMQNRIGAGPYKGLFALLVLTSFAGIIMGWRSSEPMLAYEPPTWGFHVTPLFVLAGFILFFASQAPTNIKRIVRHPQMTGTFLWAIGHLLSNGEDRSVLLFGSLAAWSLVAIIGANRRDKIWQKPDKQPWFKDAITVLIGVFVYLVFMYFHEAVIGVRPFP